MVVLAGYKTVKEALVGKAEEFGDRNVSPIFSDLNQGHGMSMIKWKVIAKAQIMLYLSAV